VVYNLNLSSDLAYLGGKTMSYRVLANSVAIDNGTSIGSVTGDQRGNARPASGWTIGSYELLRDITIDVNTDPVAIINNDVGFDFAGNQAGWLVSLRTAAFLDDAGTVTINPATWDQAFIGLVYEKPVGYTCFGLSTPRGAWVKQHTAQGDRLANKAESAQIALQLLYDHLTNL